MAKTPWVLLMCGLSTVLGATETTDLLDRFSNLSLDPPARLYEQWDARDAQPMDSRAFRQHYQNQFQRYADTARRLTARTRACATGELPQAQGYSPSPDIGQTLQSASESLAATQRALTAWLDQPDEATRHELDQDIPRLTTGYARILFELSNCSGYLYGDPVN